MKAKIKMIWIVLCWMMLSNQLLAQAYTDYKPVYNKWSSNYILDKIEYTDTRTIFYFRYVCDSDYMSVTFYGNGHEERWCLENVDDPEETYYHIDVKNIKKNETVLLKSIVGQESVTYSASKGDVFTCEVHFRRLPNRIKRVHFLEGKYKKSSTNHFHALNVKLKTSEDPNLGTFEDMVLRVQNFEKSNLGTPKTQFTTPKKENKIVPQQEKVVIQNKPAEKPKKPVAPRLNPPTTPEYPAESKARM